MTFKDWQIYAFIALLILAIFYHELVEKQAEIEEGLTVVNLTGLEIAEMSAEFLEEMKRPDGSYYPMKECDSAGNCAIEKKSTLVQYHCHDEAGKDCHNETRESYANSYAWSALAYAGLYEATGDRRYKRLLDENMEKRMEDDDPYTLWTLVQFYEAYRVTNDSDYLEYLFNETQGLWTFNRYYQEYSETENPMLLAIEAREMAIMHGILKDEESVNALKERSDIFNDEEYVKFAMAEFLNESVRSLEYAEISSDNTDYPLIEDGDFVFNSNACWIQLAKLSIYAGTEDQSYLADVSDFFTEARLAERLASGSETNFNSLVEVLPCVEALLFLSNLTGGQEFVDDAVALEDEIVLKQWDSGPLRTCDGDNGFFSSLRENNMCKGNMKTHTDTSHAIYLISRQKDRIFTIEKNE